MTLRRAKPQCTEGIGLFPSNKQREGAVPEARGMQQCPGCWWQGLWAPFLGSHTRKPKQSIHICSRGNRTLFSRANGVTRNRGHSLGHAFGIRLCPCYLHLPLQGPLPSPKCRLPSAVTSPSTSGNSYLGAAAFKQDP